MVHHERALHNYYFYTIAIDNTGQHNRCNIYVAHDEKVGLIPLNIQRLSGVSQ